MCNTFSHCIGGRGCRVGVQNRSGGVGGRDNKVKEKNKTIFEMKWKKKKKKKNHVQEL